MEFFRCDDASGMTIPLPDKGRDFWRVADDGGYSLPNKEMLTVKRALRLSILALGLLMAVMMTSLSLVQTGVVAQSTPMTSPLASPVVASTGISGAAAWLKTQQAEDGSFLGFSGKPDAGTTIDAMIALVAAKNAGVDVGDSIERALGYLGSADIALVYTQTGVGQAAKLALGLIAAGQNPGDFAHVSPMLILEHGVNADTGIYGTGLYDTALSILALVADGKDVPATVLSGIKALQADNGGWAFDGSTEAANTDSNTTSMIVQALVAMGKGDSKLVAKGVQYLTSVVSDGGATYDLKDGATPDANSTALVIQGLIAAGEDTSALGNALNGFQNADGSFSYNAATPGANVMATVQAIPALAKVAFPIGTGLPEVATPVGMLPIEFRLAA